MTHEPIPGSSFEERLLSRLKEEVIERRAADEVSATSGRATRSRVQGTRRFVFGAAGTVAVVSAALVIGAVATSTPDAFAVETQPEGMVRVEIRSLEDSKGLEDALGEVGIPASVTYLDEGMACEEPRFRSAQWPDDQSAVLVGPVKGEGPLVFLVSSETIGDGQSLVITASGHLGSSGTRVEVADGAVAPCEPVPAQGSH